MKVLPCEKPPRTLLEASTGAEWIRRPRGLSTVRVVPTSCGEGLGVTTVTAVGVGASDGVRDEVDGTPAQAETVSSAHKAAASAYPLPLRGIPPRVRRRARAGIPPPKQRWLEGRSRPREAIRIVPRSAPRR